MTRSTTTLYLAIPAILLLSGCMVKVTEEEIAVSAKVCEPHGGIAYITYDYKAWCKDGARIEYRRLLK